MPTHADVAKPRAIHASARRARVPVGEGRVGRSARVSAATNDS